MGVRSVNASAHLYNIREAVMQETVDVIRQTFAIRDAQILDPLSAARSRQALPDASTEPPSPATGRQAYKRRTVEYRTHIAYSSPLRGTFLWAPCVREEAAKRLRGPR